LDEEYLGLNTLGQTINDCLSVYISYNSYLSNAFKLKLERDGKLFLIEMKVVTGKDIAEHVIRPVKAIPYSHVPVLYAPLLIRIVGLRRELMKMKARCMRRKVGKRLTVVIMSVLSE
jgi:hypothetical protein